MFNSIYTSTISFPQCYHNFKVCFSISTGLPIITGGRIVQVLIIIIMNHEKRDNHNHHDNHDFHENQEFELVQSWGLTETMISEATFNAARAR